jgi:hypothetical protein
VCSKRYPLHRINLQVECVHIDNGTQNAITNADKESITLRIYFLKIKMNRTYRKGKKERGLNKPIGVYPAVLKISLYYTEGAIPA